MLVQLFKKKPKNEYMTFVYANGNIKKVSTMAPGAEKAKKVLRKIYGEFSVAAEPQLKCYK